MMTTSLLRRLQNDFYNKMLDSFDSAINATIVEAARITYKQHHEEDCN